MLSIRMQPIGRVNTQNLGTNSLLQPLYGNKWEYTSPAEVAVFLQFKLPLRFRCLLEWGV